MFRKKITAAAVALITLIAVFAGSLQAFAVVLHETQFEYDTVDKSWLKDLIVKEDMTSVSGMSKRCKYTPVSTYPYTATPDSFKKEVAYYQLLYTLDTDMSNVAYLYVLSLVEKFAQSAVPGYSDEYIKSYLESKGIVYPKEDSSETRIVARALFAAMVKDESFKITKGTGLYDAFTAYFSKVIGVDVSFLIRFSPDGELKDLKQIVLAACKMALYNAGYNVSKDTPDSEVYRLIVIMTIKEQGISIDSSTATFDEIKNKYLCAMMCKVYDVPFDYNTFLAAMTDGKLAFHMLQLIGKKYGIAVKDGTDYDEAFKLVAEKTGYFNLEDGEFYCDVYQYDIKLEYKRKNIWVYPETVSVDSESEGINVTVTIGNKQATENYYNQISLDENKENEKISIQVVYSDKTGVRKSSTYVLNITQGKETSMQAPTISNALSGVKDIVESMMGEVSGDSSLSSIVSNIPFELPERVLSIASLIMPNFNGAGSGLQFVQQILGYAFGNDSNINNGTIGGVGGLDSYSPAGDSSLSVNFNPGNLQITPGLVAPPVENTTQPANSLVIGDNVQYPQNIVDDDNGGSMLMELLSDTKTVAIVMGALVIVFIVSLIIFMNVLKPKDGKKNIKVKRTKR